MPGHWIARCGPDTWPQLSSESSWFLYWNHKKSLFYEQKGSNRGALFDKAITAADGIPNAPNFLDKTNSSLSRSVATRRTAAEGAQFEHFLWSQAMNVTV